MEDTFSTQALLLAGLAVLALGAVLLSVWPGIWPVERWFPNPLTPVKLYLVGAWREAAGARSPAGSGSTKAGSPTTSWVPCPVAASKPARSQKLSSSICA